ncbi:MAG TPA: SIS domain-containing protein [Vicinamibacterales bacterium]|jgi:phosphoheptose isomerase|nr:SIS domain-containing protein [Vicinamibacterales bacterium]
MPGGDAPYAEEIIERTLDAAIALHQKVRGMDVSPVARAAAEIGAAVDAGRTVLAFGNGGSAADAQHFAAELVGRFIRERAGMAAVALTADMSVLTSIANDYGFERAFARQIEALGRQGDVALAISTSGRSANVVAGLQAAAARGLTTIALTGHDGGAVGRLAQIHVNVPDASAARVQEVHRTLLHAICEIVESRDRAIG